MTELTDKDLELIDAATKAIKARYRNDWQEVGAAMRTRDGRVITGVNLDAYVGRGAVCAEAIAIGTALTDKDQELIDAATQAIKQRYRNDWQEVGAAMRTRDGRVITGVNLDAYVGRGAVCAE